MPRICVINLCHSDGIVTMVLTNTRYFANSGKAIENDVGVPAKQDTALIDSPPDKSVQQQLFQKSTTDEDDDKIAFVVPCWCDCAEFITSHTMIVCCLSPRRYIAGRRSVSHQVSFPSLDGSNSPPSESTVQVADEKDANAAVVNEEEASDVSDLSMTFASAALTPLGRMPGHPLGTPSTSPRTDLLRRFTRQVGYPQYVVGTDLVVIS